EDIFHMRRSEIQFAATFKQKLSSWVWFDVKAGYTHNFNIRYDQITPERVLDFMTAQPTGGPFISFSVFAAPPKPCWTDDHRKKVDF
ncbi:MAG: hypothetical protein AAFP19_01550, partial [Bacteroidota bacterium]